MIYISLAVLIVALSLWNFNSNKYVSYGKLIIYNIIAFVVWISGSVKLIQSAVENAFLEKEFEPILTKQLLVYGGIAHLIILVVMFFYKKKHKYS